MRAIDLLFYLDFIIPEDNKVYIIYTKDGIYDVCPTYELAEHIAKRKGLTDYVFFSIVEETIQI